MTTRQEAAPKLPKKVAAPLDISEGLWAIYKVTWQFDGPVGGSIPKNPKAILAMLQARAPVTAPPDAIPLETLAVQVAEEVGVGADGEEEPAETHNTFKRDELGFYVEDRALRAHIKDLAQQVSGFFPNIAGFRSKVANKVYVEEHKIHLMVGSDFVQVPTASETRYGAVMGARGPRSFIKIIEYVDNAVITFHLKVLRDGVITELNLRALFEYGGTHGFGPDRSLGWGRYTLTGLEKERG